MAKALYNPKYFGTGDGGKVPNAADIKRFVWSHASWSLKVNELKKFPDDVAEALLRTYGFLVEVTPKNAKEITGLQSEKNFKCQHEGCTFETDLKMALGGHMKSHGVNPETEKLLAGIEEAEGNSYRKPKGEATMEDNEPDVPDTVAGPKKDRDEVEWYGEGAQRDEVK